jgi:hypothetical protein
MVSHRGSRRLPTEDAIASKLCFPFGCGRKENGLSASIPLLPRTKLSDTHRLLVARGLRAIADGCISLVLPLYLVALGFGALDVGVIATATLLGRQRGKS